MSAFEVCASSISTVPRHGALRQAAPQASPSCLHARDLFRIGKQEANTIISMVVITMVRPTSAISNNSTSTSLHQFVCTWTDKTYQYDNYTFAHVFYTLTSARATLPSAGTRLREYKESYFILRAGGLTLSSAPDNSHKVSAEGPRNSTEDKPLPRGDGA